VRSAHTTTRTVSRFAPANALFGFMSRYEE
jgi:hypothetical protein